MRATALFRSECLSYSAVDYKHKIFRFAIKNNIGWHYQNIFFFSLENIKWQNQHISHLSMPNASCHVYSCTNLHDSNCFLLLHRHDTNHSLLLLHDANVKMYLFVLKNANHPFFFMMQICFLFFIYIYTMPIFLFFFFYFRSSSTCCHLHSSSSISTWCQYAACSVALALPSLQPRHPRPLPSSPGSSEIIANNHSS